MVSNKITKSVQFPNQVKSWLTLTDTIHKRYDRITLSVNDSHFSDLNLIIIIVAIKMKCSIRTKRFSL